MLQHFERKQNFFAESVVTIVTKREVTMVILLRRLHV